MFVFYYHTLLECLSLVTYHIGMHLWPRNFLIKKKESKIEELNNWWCDKACSLSLLQDKRLLLGKKIIASPFLLQESGCVCIIIPVISDLNSSERRKSQRTFSSTLLFKTGNSWLFSLNDHIICILGSKWSFPPKLNMTSERSAPSFTSRARCLFYRPIFFPKMKFGLNGSWWIDGGNGQICTWFRNRREVYLSLLCFCFHSLLLEPGSCPSFLTVPGMDQTHCRSTMECRIQWAGKGWWWWFHTNLTIIHFLTFLPKFCQPSSCLTWCEMEGWFTTWDICVTLGKSFAKGISPSLCLSWA